MTRLTKLFAIALFSVGLLNAQATLAPMPVFAPLDNNGLPLNGGNLCSYSAGTSTPLATYTDSTASVPNSNPVVLNAAGRANVWLSTSSLYKLVLQGPAGTTCPSGPILWTVDNVSGVGGGGGGSFLPLAGGTMTGAILASGGQNLGDPTHAFGTLYANNGVYMGASQVIFPDTSATVKNLTVTGTCTGCGGGGGGGANTALSNLATTAINQTLLPNATNTFDLGSATKVWNNLFVNNLTINGICTGAACPGGGGGGGGGSGANTSLSNLVATSINQSLVPQSNAFADSGGSGKNWANVWAGNYRFCDISTGTACFTATGNNTTWNLADSVATSVLTYSNIGGLRTWLMNGSLIPVGSANLGSNGQSWQTAFIQNLVVNGTCSGTAFPSGCGGGGGGGVGPNRAIQFTNGGGGLQGTSNGLLDSSGNLTVAGFGTGRNFTACGGSALTCSAGNNAFNAYNLAVTTIVAYGGTELGLNGAGEWVALKSDGSVGASIDGLNGVFTKIGYYAGALAGVTGATCTVFTLGICTHL